jgi:hypothetical protein
VAQVFPVYGINPHLNDYASTNITGGMSEMPICYSVMSRDHGVGVSNPMTVLLKKLRLHNPISIARRKPMS